MTASYIGLDRATGRALTDTEHIAQSVRDILITPIGTRVMRRNYGSLLAEMIDQPHTPALELQIKVACYMAVLAWEPRIVLTSVTTERLEGGQLVVTLTGQRANDDESINMRVPVSF